MDGDNDPVEAARDRQRTERDLGDKERDAHEGKGHESPLGPEPEDRSGECEDEEQGGEGRDEPMGIFHRDEGIPEVRHDGTVAQRPVRTREPRSDATHGPTKDNRCVRAERSDERDNQKESPVVDRHEAHAVVGESPPR